MQPAMHSLVQTLLESKMLAGALRGPENLYNNITHGAVNKVGRLLPADKGEVQDLKAELQEYKAQTTAVIDALVEEVNILTPVRSPFPACLQTWQCVCMSSD